MIRRRRSALVAMAVAAGWLLAACDGPPSGSGQAITLYNGQHVQTTDALVSAFEKATGITVNVRSDDEDTLADQVVAEGSRSPADVIYTENSPALEYLQGRGLLAPVDPATLADTPSRSASSVPVQSRGVCSSESSRSSRADVSSMGPSLPAY